MSARVAFLVAGDELDAEAWLDDLQFVHYDLLIFTDGFESGDTSGWDATQGTP
jgi:hypothetical protein